VITSSSFSYLLSLFLAHLVTPLVRFLVQRIDHPGALPKHTCAIDDSSRSSGTFQDAIDIDDHTTKISAMPCTSLSSSLPHKPTRASPELDVCTPHRRFLIGNLTLGELSPLSYLDHRITIQWL
jgi:hypothetical protein